MKIVFAKYPKWEVEHREIPLSEFANRHGLDLRITEHSQLEPPRFYADFVQFVEIMYDGTLGGVGSFGRSPCEAVIELCKKISNRRLVDGAYTTARREFDSPTVVPGRLVPGRLVGHGAWSDIRSRLDNWSA